MIFPFQIFTAIGAIGAMLAVICGAFGAHALRGQLTPDMMAVFQTATQYHMYHALGLILVGLVGERRPDVALAEWAGWLMVAGIVVFSGSLYTLALTGVRWLGVITPIGGVAFIAAWALLALAAIRGR